VPEAYSGRKGQKGIAAGRELEPREEGRMEMRGGLSGGDGVLWNCCGSCRHGT